MEKTLVTALDNYRKECGVTFSGYNLMLAETADKVITDLYRRIATLEKRLDGQRGE